MVFNFIRRSLILSVKNGNEFLVFKSLSVCLFRRRGPHDDIENLVTPQKIFGSLKLYSLYFVE